MIEIGKTIGRYHIVEQLGEGGMATVYKAYDTRLEREVAVKVLRTEQFAPVVLERVLKRFEREAKALAKLTHPNIVPILDYGEQDGQPYLVMPYLAGGTLKELLKRRGRLGWWEAVGLLLPVLEALGYAHEHGVLHRDVKPSNILLTEEGQPLLSDFGIAKILDVEEGQTLTGTGVGIGTPEYMSPEQGMGREVDERTDIYSAGVVLYEMVTGRTPYEADTPMAVVLKHVNDPLPRPKELVSDIPEELEHVLYKALAKNSVDRYRKMKELLSSLNKLIQLNPIYQNFELSSQKVEVFPSHNLREMYNQRQKISEETREEPEQIKPTSSDKTKSNKFLLVGSILFLLSVIILILTITIYSQLILKNYPQFETEIVGTSEQAILIVNSPTSRRSTITVTATKTHVQTAIPTTARTPTTNRKTPTKTKSSLEIEVENFIVYYWGLVGNKEFETSYQYLTESFKKNFKIETIESYKDGFKYTERIEVRRTEAISVSKDFAIVEADLDFYAISGNVVKVFHRYRLLKEDGRWKIDMSEKRR